MKRATHLATGLDDIKYITLTSLKALGLKCMLKFTSSLVFVLSADTLYCKRLAFKNEIVLKKA
jgi:hypothetical protein